MDPYGWCELCVNDVIMNKFISLANLWTIVPHNVMDHIQNFNLFLKWEYVILIMGDSPKMESGKFTNKSMYKELTSLHMQESMLKPHLEFLDPYEFLVIVLARNT